MTMENGNAFLKSQIDNAVVQHDTFLKALEAHEVEADDPRFSNLCARHLPHMRDHRRMLAEYQSQLGGPSIVKSVIGSAANIVRDLADAAHESDYLSLVGDIVLSDQAEDAFKTFREAGKMMGNRTLQEIGDIGERHHDAYAKEANRLVQHMFVERVQGVDGIDAHARKSTYTDLDATI
jgi:hypothetical protein